MSFFIRAQSCQFLFILLFVMVASAVMGEETYYTLYREGAHRCMLVTNPAAFQPGDRIFGGPYPLKEALVEVKKACPVQFEESGSWFAVLRGDSCWIVKGKANLKEGDAILDGNLLRDLAVASVLEVCEHYGVDEGGIEEPTTPAPATVENTTWQETTVPWVKVRAPKGVVIVTKVIDGKSLPAGDFKSISTTVSIEPQGDDAIPSEVRITMPETVHVPAEAKGRVALAFYEESYSPCTGKVESRWRLHAVDYDPQSGTWEATLHHNSFVVWGLVTLGIGVTTLAWDDATRLLMTKRRSNHFVLHYNRSQVTEETVTYTLDQLERARDFLAGDLTQGGLGLSYPSVPAKLDVYYVRIKSKDAIYGLYQQGKTGARWMDLNLPSNIKNYNNTTLRATLTHELFHFVQFPYEGYSTKLAWGVGTFPYGWLNEALSSAVELTADNSPFFVPNQKSPILNSDLLIKGLKGLQTADDGYSAGLFIDFLVHRYGVEVYSAILNECRRQVESGTARDAYAAIKRAVSRMGRKTHPGDPNFTEMDAVWQNFTNTFIREEAGPPKIDGRPDRKIPFINPPSIRLGIGEDETVQRWTIAVPPVSLNPRAAKTFNIVPAEWNDEEKAVIECRATFTPGKTIPFDIDTLITLATRKGEHALLPKDTLLLGRVSRKAPNLTFTLNLEKKNRFNLLTFIPTGLGAAAKQGEAQGSYTLSCKLRKEESLTVAPAVPVSTSKIDTYWWALWQTAVTMKSTGKRAYEICPARCDTLNQEASNEWKTLSGRIRILEGKMDVMEKEMRPVLKLLEHYLEAPGEMKSFMEISNNTNDMRNICVEVTNAAERFTSLYPIGNKATVVQHFSWLKNTHSQIMKRDLPTREKLQKVLDRFHKDMAQMKPCESALDSLSTYWNKHKQEAMQKVEEIKTRHPSFK